jgi:phosphocarrier protein HPr
MPDVVSVPGNRLFLGMRKEVEIVNKLGLHARPAALFVRWAIRFKSTITIWRGEEKFSATSLLEVLTANLDCGARVILEAIGPDEQEAINQLEALLLRFRDEEGGAQEKLKHTRTQFQKRDRF